MSFKEYDAKPITRLAHEITEDDIISNIAPHYFRLKLRSGEEYNFTATKTIKTGDFIVYDNDNDIYHCPRDLFAKTNKGVDE